MNDKKEQDTRSDTVEASDYAANGAEVKKATGSEKKKSDKKEKTSAEELLEQKQQELDTMRNQMMRQVAQERNEKEAAITRANKELEQARRYAVVDMAAQLFTIADDMDRAAEELRKQKKESATGVELIAKNLQEVFAKFSIESITAKAGDNFDPHNHEAVSVQSTTDHPDGTVVEVVQSGYLLEGRVLRPVRVIVAKAPQSDGDESEQKSDN